MSYYANLQIAYAMFIDYLKQVFGSPCEFYTLAPGHSEGYVK